MLGFSKLQADIETDEVYAQMTLQPLTAVLYIYFFFMVANFCGL